MALATFGLGPCVHALVKLKSGVLAPVCSRLNLISRYSKPVFNSVARDRLRKLRLPGVHIVAQRNHVRRTECASDHDIRNRARHVESRDPDIRKRRRKHLLLQRSRKSQRGDVEALAEGRAEIRKPRDRVTERPQQARAERVIIFQHGIAPAEYLRARARRRGIALARTEPRG